MCGIFGIVGGAAQQLLTPRTLEYMAKSLTARGPDDTGMYMREGAGLGATRLAIIDVKGGNQPLFNEDRSIWVVQNGELYNYRGLKEELLKRGHRFSSQSDTEVYVHLYEELGLKFVEKLRGMFALALWDGRKRRLVLARDRLGIKPLYYSEVDDKLLFASELKALLAGGIKRQINHQAIADYLTLNYIPGPASIYRGVNKLPAGTLLVWEKGQVSKESYWEPMTSQVQTELEDIGLETRLRQLLEETVKYHLISDVAVGAFLSGGIDSSAVVALASRLSAKRLKTFAVGFREKSYDELKYARIVATRFKTQHQEITLAINPQTLVEEIGRYLDEPFADSSAIGVWAIAKAVRKTGIKVMLSGDGGDEVFGGYSTYQADQLRGIFNRLPRWLREKVIAVGVKRLPASHKKTPFEFKAKRFIRGASEDPLLAHFLWKVIFTDEQIKKLLTQPRRHKPTIRLWREVFENTGGGDSLSRLMLTDLRTSLADDMLTKVDRMSMANSLEVRVPLLDHKLVEFMVSLPAKYKVKGLNLKYLLKKSLRGLLPQTILSRAKAGFHVPVAEWLKNDLREIVGDYLSPKLIKAQGFFDPELVQRLVTDHQKRQADNSREIWGLLMFGIWLNSPFGPGR